TFRSGPIGRSGTARGDLIARESLGTRSISGFKDCQLVDVEMTKGTRVTTLIITLQNEIRCYRRKYGDGLTSGLNRKSTTLGMPLTYPILAPQQRFGHIERVVFSLSSVLALPSRLIDLECI